MQFHGIKKAITRMLILTILLMAAKSAYPEYGAIPESSIDPAVIRIDEEKYLGTRLDKDYILIDENGGEFRLKDLTGKPLILLLSYYSCNGLCPTANRKLKDVLAGIDRFRIGEDFRILTLSFDKNDDVHSLRMFREMAGLQELSGESWKIALMKNKEDIGRLTGSVGFKFFWSSRDKMFLHPNAFIFLSPEGRVVRYLYGTPPDMRDVELAITEANLEKTTVSRVMDLVSMACYSYNFKEGRYTVNYPLFIGFGSLFLGVSSIVVPIIIKRKRKRHRLR